MEDLKRTILGTTILIVLFVGLQVIASILCEIITMEFIMKCAYITFAGLTVYFVRDFVKELKG